MIGYADAPKAWWLTRGMARIAGVNLSKAVIEGWLERAELARIVDRCETCAHAEECDLWLARSGAARQMPDFCPNKPAIEALVAP